MNNADLPYRPLLCGVSLLNPRIGEPGTLGYLGRDTTGNSWLISAYHVLCNSDLSPYTADEAIFQPAANFPPYQIAFTRSSKSSVELDCAAGLLIPGITCINSQLGLGSVNAPTAPVLGMRVAKAGAVTGVTEGFITQIIGDDLRIESDPDFDANYLLSDVGDSGSLWVEQETCSPVGLHRGHSSPRRADASSILAVLAVLGLQPLQA
jgi:hypothetical protein